MNPVAIGNARAEYSVAKASWRWLLGIQLFSSLASAVVSLATGSAVAFCGGVVALGVPVVVYFLKDRADKAYERGEAIRRMTLLDDGIGVRPEASEVARLHAELTDQASSDPDPIGGYYTCDLPKGPRRLASLVWEASHFTTHLAKSASLLAGGAALLGVALVLVWLVAFVASPGLGGQPSPDSWELAAGPKMAGAAAALLSVFGLGILGDLWRSFRALSETASQTCKRCERLVERPYSRLEDVLPVLGDYDAALARAAPIPSLIWRRQQKKLTASWNSAMRALKERRA